MEKKNGKLQKTVSLTSISKMIAAGEIPGIKDVTEFMDKYKNHRGTSWGGSDRFAVLEGPIGEDEAAMLVDYLTVGKAVKDMTVRWGMSPGSFYSKVEKAALKLVYQNSEKLGLPNLRKQNEAKS